MDSFWQRNYVAFAELSAPYIGERATLHSYRARWAGFLAGGLCLVWGPCLLVSDGHGALGTFATVVEVLALTLVLVMVIEFWVMTKTASRHLGVRFRFRDLRELRPDRFDAWLADQTPNHPS